MEGVQTQNKLPLTRDEILENTRIVATVCLSADLVQHIMKNYRFVAMAVKGHTLITGGPVALLLLATPDGFCYILDTYACENIIPNGGIKDLLECNEIIKVVYNYNLFCDAIRRFGITTKKIFDVQIAHQIIEGSELRCSPVDIKPTNLKYISETYGRKMKVPEAQDYLRLECRRFKYLECRPLLCDVIDCIAREVLCLVPEVYVNMCLLLPERDLLNHTMMQRGLTNNAQKLANNKRGSEYKHSTAGGIRCLSSYSPSPERCTNCINCRCKKCVYAEMVKYDEPVKCDEPMPYDERRSRSRTASNSRSHSKIPFSNYGNVGIGPTPWNYKNSDNRIRNLPPYSGMAKGLANMCNKRRRDKRYQRRSFEANTDENCDNSDRESDNDDNDDGNDNNDDESVTSHYSQESRLSRQSHSNRKNYHKKSLCEIV